MNISRCDGSQGVFIFDSYYKSMKSFKSKALRWDLFEAIYEYSLNGVVKDVSPSLMPVLTVIMPFIDNKKQKLPRGNPHGKSIEERIGIDSPSKKGDTSATKKTGDNSCEIFDKSGQEKTLEIESRSQKSLTNFRDNYKELKTINAQLNNNKNSPLYNKNKNEDKNKTSSSSSVEFGASKSLGEETQERQPTKEEVKEFFDKSCFSVGYLEFYNFYESRGWKVGGRKIKSWRACAIEWNNRFKQKQNLLKSKTETKINERNYDENELNSRLVDLTKIDVESLDI